jgi:hypothetical protein
MFTRVHQDDECLCEHIYADVAQILTNRITDKPSFLVLFSLQESKEEADSASGDVHLNDDDDDDDSSFGSGSEHSCLQAPVDSHTDVSHSESKSLLQ